MFCEGSSWYPRRRRRWRRRLPAGKLKTVGWRRSAPGCLQLRAVVAAAAAGLHFDPRIGCGSSGTGSCHLAVRIDIWNWRTFWKIRIWGKKKSVAPIFFFFLNLDLAPKQAAAAILKFESGAGTSGAPPFWIEIRARKKGKYKKCKANRPKTSLQYCGAGGRTGDAEVELQADDATGGATADAAGNGMLLVSSTGVTAALLTADWFNEVPGAAAAAAAAAGTTGRHWV